VTLKRIFPCCHAGLQPQLPPRWQWLPEPEVALFTATNLPRLDMNFHLAPEATLDSGGCLPVLFCLPA
jgi:hypothetical protein